VSRVAIGAAVLLLLAVGAAAFWAGRVALAPPDDPLAAGTERVTYEVIEQTLGESLQFAAVAEWGQSILARAGAQGVVTSINFTDGDQVAAGDVLFTVNLRPTILAAGEVPSFRDLQPGDSGPDVTQLENLLSAQNFLEGPPDDSFDSETAEAVAAWQRSLGVAEDGIVRRGDIIFAPEIPLRVVATEALTVGEQLSGGEIVLNKLSAAPAVVIPLTPEQRGLVPLSGQVRVDFADGSWDAVIARAEETSEGGVDRLDLVLESPDGGAICGDACVHWVPPNGRATFAAEIVVVPETTGPVVPVAAVLTDAGGRHIIELANGDQVSIEVLASSRGLAVVRGINIGDVVVLPFSAPPSP
jgi:peptidoglycan hydrolase-like protein with peptidoglycan-binding domain